MKKKQMWHMNFEVNLIMIELTHVDMSYQNKKVISNLNLIINEGDVVSIIGPSGAGKSTLLRIFNLLNCPSNGRYTIDNVQYDFTKLSRNDIKLIRQKFAMVFQQYGLFENKSVFENVYLPLVKAKNFSIKEAKEKAKDWLSRVGLNGKLTAYPNQLSGGQKQRVAIARSLAMEPEILLLDEPTAALDPELVNGILQIIKNLADTKQYTIIIVTHEMEFARQVSDKVLFLDDGQIIDYTIPKNIFDNPQKTRIKHFIEQINSSWD